TVALFAFAGALFAQSSFVGTWKLDTAKTKYTAGEPPKDLTVVVEEQGDNLQVTVTGTNADGSPISAKYTMPANGGAGQVQEGPFDAVSSRRISANVRENSYSKNGKEMMSRRITVSKDGKTIRETVKGVNAAGNAIAGTDIFRKQ
ncbi:MAG TPA: hypothetical protein VKV15_02420, partial [Bryobacteraceae bacterium]|nr:hypothetical protein [Bryobacteraceae bacterium]